MLESKLEKKLEQSANKLFGLKNEVEQSIQTMRDYQQELQQNVKEEHDLDKLKIYQSQFKKTSKDILTMNKTYEDLNYEIFEVNAILKY